jgi:hypothetical protein
LFGLPRAFLFRFCFLGRGCEVPFLWRNQHAIAKRKPEEMGL